MPSIFVPPRSIPIRIDPPGSTNILDRAEVMRAGTSMPPFGRAYSLEQLHDVASHIVSRVLPQR